MGVGPPAEQRAAPALLRGTQPGGPELRSIPVQTEFREQRTGLLKKNRRRQAVHALALAARR